MTDPTVSDPDKYKVVFENDRVRVLEYRDEPGQKTSPHEHPDSVMLTLSSFDRRLVAGGCRVRDGGELHHVHSLNDVQVCCRACRASVSLRTWSSTT